MTDFVRPRVLILASRYDLSCDYVVARLRQRGVAYLRLNTEDLPEFALTLDPIARVLTGRSPEFSFEVGANDLRAVYFRRPVFLRESGSLPKTAEARLSRAHWAAFMRAFMLFDNCRWMNHPTATYRAETKPLQLARAAMLGFRVPKTVVANTTLSLTNAFGDSTQVVMKGLDTVLVSRGSEETFGFTNILPPGAVHESEMRTAPAIIQEMVEPKLDLRITVVDRQVFAVSVTSKNQRIRGDWRLKASEAEFVSCELPQPIADRCVALVEDLGLAFGAIDLALQDDEYFFFEINPTGEWAWLTQGNDLPIDDAIAQFLSGER
jgi:glutathione synthase/RimK-type ligase-like ATP-grasp enzyme